MEDILNERLELVSFRLKDICDDSGLSGEAKLYFTYQATFMLKICDIYKTIKQDGIDEVSLSKLKEWNEYLYSDIADKNYDGSYTNPSKCVASFGSERGRLLSTVAAELRSSIGAAYEGDLLGVLIRAELIAQLYGAFLDEAEDESLKDIIYYYVFDYTDECSDIRVREMVDPSLSFATDIIMKSDLSKTDYLYRYGEYITDNEIRLSKHIAGLSEETVEKIASTFSEGYRIGFVNTGKNLSKKTTVNIRYPLGMERIIKKSVANFEAMGLKPVIYRAGNSLFRRQGTSKIGFFGANPSRQYDFDHKEDEALFLDGNFVTRKLECLEASFEKYKELAYGHAGPAVMEVFGEDITDNISKDEAISLTEKQQKLSVKYSSQAGAITNRYIKGEERSFTIIAFPVPAIGDEFGSIFDETIKINTLDYKLYQSIQQTIIDTLDKASYVHIKGMNDNRTDINVNLVSLKNPDKETKFENCVADVNIPVGEVFTSPVLKGTDGILHVSRVYLNELEYKNLEIRFKDGRTTTYSCSNYDSASKNEKYIKDNILFHHEYLPIGEFAIGTNTTAYEMGKKYNIAAKLPILIAEKTGPHFALGDTCYSHEEDLVAYNPDGKAIVARENEISALRNEDISKAYFNCHTDITIPYDELGLIEAIMEDGTSIDIIKNGRFVLDGTLELNKAFDN